MDKSVIYPHFFNWQKSGLPGFRLVINRIHRTYYYNYLYINK
ncbi:hypothetical protein G134_545 [Lactobacillus delbrueckii subsp. lactis CRL581]|nr:hypothetical protein G134_545 [Lactobacillus delbrueckii subsp. lactis CRL581]